MLNIDSFNLTENEAAVLSILSKHEGRNIGDEYLCERALDKPMTDEGREIAALIGSLREKLRDNGYGIRRVTTELEETPGECYVSTEYALVPEDELL